MNFIDKTSCHYSSLVSCVKEGVTAELVIRALDFYLIPFALFLGADTKQVGLLMSIPHLLCTIALLFTPGIARMVGNRQKVLVFTIGVQACLLATLPLLPFFHTNVSLLVLIGVIALFRTSGAVMGPVWGSLVSHYLPDDTRGKFFGSRSRFIGIAGLAGTLVWAAILSLSQYTSEAWGYVILFASVFVARLFSFYFARRMEEIPITDEPRARFRLDLKAQLKKYFRDRRLTRFLVFMAWMTFATQFALPFFSVWLRKNLALDYTWYTAIQMTSVIVGLYFFPIWGKRADKYGNMRVMRLSNLMIAFIPLLWIMARHPVLIIMIECLSGFAWAGFNLCCSNFVYEVCRPQDRVRGLVSLNLVTGLSAFLGTLTGGFLVEALPPVMGHSLLSLFVISSMLRLTGEALLPSQKLEIREGAPKISTVGLLLSMLRLRPAAIAVSETRKKF